MLGEVMTKDTIKIDVFKETLGHIRRLAAEKGDDDLSKKAGLLALNIINDEYHLNPEKRLNDIENEIALFWDALEK